MTNGTPSAGSDPQSLETLPQLPPESAPSVQLAVRPHVGLWDRLKLILLLIAVFWLLAWSALANNPIEAFGDAVAHELATLWWLEALLRTRDPAPAALPHLGALPALAPSLYDSRLRSPGRADYGHQRLDPLPDRTA